MEPTSVLDKLLDQTTTIAEIEGMTAPEAYQLAEFGWMMLGNGQTEIAVTIFEMLTLSNPHHAYFFALLGSALARENRIKEALEAYQRAIALDPDETAALVNRAELLLGLADRSVLSEAETLLDRALSIDAAAGRPEVRRARVLLETVHLRRVEVPGITEAAVVI